MCFERDAEGVAGGGRGLRERGVSVGVDVVLE